MTRPYTRSCRQTNFSEGEFVNKVPFLLFFLISYSYFLSFLFLTFFFALLSFFQVGPWPIGSPPDYTGEIGSQC